MCVIWVCLIPHKCGHYLRVFFFSLTVQRTFWHSCRTVNAPWLTWGRKAPDFGWATFGWANCIIYIFVPFLSHWTLLSSLRPASNIRPTLHWWPAETSWTQASARAQPSPPRHPHYNQPLGHSGRQRQISDFLTFVLDGQCSIANLRLKGPWLQVGELHHWHLFHPCIALDFAVKFKL